MPKKEPSPYTQKNTDKNNQVKKYDQFWARVLLENQNSLKFKEKLAAIENYQGELNNFHLETIILGLSDSEMKVRRRAARELLKFDKKYYPSLIDHLSDKNYYTRCYISWVLGKWFPKFTGLKYYQIVRKIPINIRTKCVENLIETIVNATYVSVLNDAVYFLENIGDFRSIPTLKNSTKVFSSQQNKHQIKYNDYSTFIIVLKYVQSQSESEIRKEILENRFGQLLRLTSDYNYHPVFKNIFNALGLNGQLIFQMKKASLKERILKTTDLAAGTTAYKTMIWILRAFYPNSLREIANLKKEIENPIKKGKLAFIEKDILLNFEISLKSGFHIYL